MATAYDEVRSDVKECQEKSLEALRAANTRDARSVVTELEEADSVDGVECEGKALGTKEGTFV
jgi:phage shock protein A